MNNDAVRTRYGFREREMMRTATAAQCSEGIEHIMCGFRCGDAAFTWFVSRWIHGGHLGRPTTPHHSLFARALSLLRRGQLRLMF